MEIFRPRLGKILPDGGTLGAHVKLSISGPVGRQRAFGGARKVLHRLADRLLAHHMPQMEVQSG